MSLFLPKLSKPFVALVMLLGVTANACAADSDPTDTEELYAYLFPGTEKAQPSSMPAENYAAPATGAVTGFGSKKRRAGWSQDQVMAMREAFKRKEDELPEAQAPAGVVPVPTDSGLYDPQGAPIGDGPYAELIKQNAKEQDVNESVISEIIAQESRNDPNAISPKGAQGLMQLMPSLSKQFNIDPFDVAMNIKVGTRYFAELLAKYKRLDYALAAYNAGPGAVDKYNGIPPFPETQNYVSSILARVSKYEASN
ncbi:hypothetical protein ALP33_200159 [Pseudomonas amygdali pv. lachrymans]|uniref:Transglycosylase SLT domain-containing protein n=2 Tax=Pseudomonas syringae group genomosp. 2 TaxID=251698 RepID=A0A0P9WAN6_9PSED|nr:MULTISPECIES: lytic transglycosylase domain-containing protein [Pseudomonas syringae group]KPX80385.1 Uncharacterized protein ALO64_00870 [Pseudomonas meliae]RMP35049.1 hypothetical protein ALQ26_200131 [Pseudomonas amygdali pv. lachrymans]RMU13528.1 hypothetical protein ALP33_200159 [Pseudomonas amygdali pv. lachrymans]RMV50769.1 hypothetical protein ALP09_200062 [Pseudomonas amygdali pv. lachrymans]RXU06347.1 hypothetical protein B1F68_12520 [Pseudomonas syringae]